MYRNVFTSTHFYRIEWRRYYTNHYLQVGLFFCIIKICAERERYLEQVIKERTDLAHQLSSIRQQAQDSIEYHKNVNQNVSDQNNELQRSNKQLRETIQVTKLLINNLNCKQLARRSQLSGNSEMLNEFQSILGNFKETITQE
jgi:septal ring factor EnvC (AmiA/AmiB activator)